MEQKLKEIIAKVLSYVSFDIELRHSLANDLGADCLDILEIVMDVEDEFKVHIHDKDKEKIKTVEDLMNIVAKLSAPEQTRVRKTVKKRVVKFVETTYDDGTVSLRPRTRGFNDFELVGLLSYYHDLYKVQMMQHNIKKND